MGHNEFLAGASATGISAVGTALQTQETLQIISLIITCVGALISMIIIPIITWYKNAKKDGKIDKKEVKEAIDIIQNGIEGIKENLNDKKEGDKK